MSIVPYQQYTTSTSLPSWLNCHTPKQIPQQNLMATTKPLGLPTASSLESPGLPNDVKGGRRKAVWQPVESNGTAFCLLYVANTQADNIFN